MNKKYGFTLLEILVVVMIITILTTIVGVNVIPRLGQAKTAAAVAQIGIFKTALSLYRMDNDCFPTQEQGLEALNEKPTIAPIPEKYVEQGYLESQTLPLDPWSHDYVYIVPGPDNQPYKIVSYGADGEPGGDGKNVDISSFDM